LYSNSSLRLKYGRKIAQNSYDILTNSGKKNCESILRETIDYENIEA